MSSPNTKGQLSISSYFATQSGSPSKHFARQGEKRPASAVVVDLTSDGDASEAEPPPKKTKTSSAAPVKNEEQRIFVPDLSNPLHERLGPEPGPSTLMTTPPPRPRTPVGSVKKYSFNNASESNDVPETPEEKRAKKARREAFKRRLLGDNNMFSKQTKRAPPVEERRPALISDAVDIDDLENIRDREEDESSLEASDREMSALPNSVTSKAFLGFKGKGKENPQMTSSARKAKKVTTEEIGPSGETYTPLEKQIKSFKKKYPDAILMIEVGYKYRFFGEDAKIASELLGIVQFVKRNFWTASIPTHRRDIHLKKLLSHGYKVGIIGQIETAALKKVSENRNNPFHRALTNMYTAATYIDEVESVDDPLLLTPPIFMCITEGLLGGMGADERVSFGIVAITPSTGDVVWDEFEDGFMRSELETRMAHIKPSEILVSSKTLSKVTEKVLHYQKKEASSNESARDKVRLERYKDELGYTDAFQQLQTFYMQKNKGKASENFKSGKLLAAISDLPRKASIALAHSVNYLNSFGLADVLTQTQFFTKFTERQHMLLNANTLANLEIYRNQTDLTTKGSLMWVLNKTKTAFGARLLRSWIGRPLVDVSALQARVDAVETIRCAEAFKSREHLLRLQDLLRGLKDVDLARGLSRIQYSKCTPKELAKLLMAFSRVANSFDIFASLEDVGFSTPVLNEIVFALPKLRSCMKQIMTCINLEKAKEDKRDELWSDPDKYPEVDDTKMAIMAVESELADHLKMIRKILKKPAAQYVTIKDDEYLIEVKKNERRDIPLTWEVVTSTKSARRYRTPEVKKKLQERAQYQEKLEAEANKAYLAFLAEIMDEHYVTLRNAVNKLAIADCLFSLAAVASQDDYVKPTFVEDDVLEITDGRHPMVELLRQDPFVHNSLCLGGSDTRAKIITGPNMGGKSSAVRMVALIALMAQIGSYVPAASVRMSPLDAILTRMGASDDLARGRSTFMVEMSETSDILHSATPKSLVVLDELGRGSSTFDGMAIAGATLEHLVEKKECKTLFITHYPVVAISTERKYPSKATNLHMGFTEDTTIEGKRVITFLYRLTNGISSGSYGIECARLAGIPEKLLESASEQAEKMQKAVQNRGRTNRHVDFRSSERCIDGVFVSGHAKRAKLCAFYRHAAQRDKGDN
ncbi:muts domain V-domain-containing protein [Phellopilus nigrolimitatus]|nr:muts domain V-domain-containing protein [Phellopilus nigrolimitatus]